MGMSCIRNSLVPRKLHGVVGHFKAFPSCEAIWSPTYTRIALDILSTVAKQATASTWAVYLSIAQCYVRASAKPFGRIRTTTIEMKRRHAACG